MGHGGGGGCPIYWLTWADMITLLMTFFVVLASLGKIEETDKYNAIVESMRETFGYFTPGNKVDVDEAGMTGISMVKKIQEQVARQSKNTSKKTPNESQIGNSSTVRNIRDGLMITVGGVASFGAGSAELLPSAAEDLLSISQIIKGYRNRVLIRGHASRQPLPAGSPFRSQMELSYARGVAVLNFLVQQGVAKERLNVESCGDNEPVKSFAYDEEAVANNRRVEVIVKDSAVEDFVGQPNEQK